MTNRRILIAAACAAALMLPGTMTAQVDTTSRRDTTTRRPRATSEQRLRVQKGEASGTLDLRADSLAAVERARVDSMNLAMQRQRDLAAAAERARSDSLAAIERARADSVARIDAFRRDSVARSDSIAAAEEARRLEMARYRFGGNGWYMGIGAGASAPTNDFKNLGYNSGLNVHVPIGWHRDNSALGVRFDLGYSRFSGQTFTGTRPLGAANTIDNPNPQVFSATANVTLATPLSLLRNVRLYGVGGAGVYHFRSFGGGSALGGFLGNDVLQTNENKNKSTRNKIGAQAGAGLDWTVGTSSVYVESRFVNVFANRDDGVAFTDFFGDRGNSLRWVPIVLGVKIR
ncbi:hypothetical protein [Gemmatimonas sp.]|uniref:hypothetical protein n=1 Tax=Gemmatimonas sp. TaxID=1962908 RepID=UPI003341A26D